MNDNTFIKLYRSLLNWRWYTEGNTCRLFLHLLLTANIAPRDFRTETIQRGELVTTIKNLSDELKLSPQAVRTSLNHLISTNEVTKRTTAKYTIITIKNYDNFQSVTKSLTNNQQTINKQLTNNQHSNKNKRIKEVKNIYSARTREREQSGVNESYDINELMRIK